MSPKISQRCLAYEKQGKPQEFFLTKSNKEGEGFLAHYLEAVGYGVGDRVSYLTSIRQLHQVLLTLSPPHSKALMSLKHSIEYLLLLWFYAITLMPRQWLEACSNMPEMIWNFSSKLILMSSLIYFDWLILFWHCEMCIYFVKQCNTVWILQSKPQCK